MKMQFGSFVFLENPIKLNLTYSKNINIIFIPDVGEFAQNVGRAAKIVRGEALFTGENSNYEFEKLVAFFDLSQESKLLILPNGEMFFSYFSKLELKGEGGAKKINYSFEFIEDMQKKKKNSKTYKVTQNDTILQVALKNKVGIDHILKNNSHLINKDKLKVGEDLQL